MQELRHLPTPAGRQDKEPIQLCIIPLRHLNPLSWLYYIVIVLKLYNKLNRICDKVKRYFLPSKLLFWNIFERPDKKNKLALRIK